MRRVGTLDVISFFEYADIELFLLSKYELFGHRIFRYFSRRHMAPFLEAFAEGLDRKIHMLCIDDNCDRGYSHTAILGHYAQNEKIEVLHSVLRATNRVNYAGKSLEYRLGNPRKFEYSGPRDIEVILIDDIVTTGLTLQEAHNILLEKGVDVLFALTLADASR